jgi:RNA polymerase sigma factor (TIGR02999 family)
LSDVTQILSQIDAGDPSAAEQLLPLVYAELRRLARAQMIKERAEHTLQPTDLVHEAYLRLVGDTAANWDSRGHFFSAAAEAMRRILVEHARAKNAIKRGGQFERVDLDEFPPIVMANGNVEELLELDEALERFSREDADTAALVKLIYFAGLSVGEAAAVQGISRATAHRHWLYARAWLRDAITGKEKVGLFGNEF